MFVKKTETIHTPYLFRKCLHQCLWFSAVMVLYLWTNKVEFNSFSFGRKTTTTHAETKHHRHRTRVYSIRVSTDTTSKGTKHSVFTRQLLLWIWMNRPGKIISQGIIHGSWSHPAYLGGRCLWMSITGSGSYFNLVYLTLDEARLNRRGTVGPRWSLQSTERHLTCIFLHLLTRIALFQSPPTAEVNV